MRKGPGALGAPNDGPQLPCEGGHPPGPPGRSGDGQGWKSPLPLVLEEQSEQPGQVAVPEMG